jgi:ABC-type uncharacterized transport system auxiliary subunit
MKSRIRAIALVLPTLLLSGCINVNVGDRGEPPDVYTLNGAPAAGAAPAAPARAAGRVVAVPEPELPPGLDTDRIALYFEKERRLDYYADSKWPKPLGEVLQDLVIRRMREKLPGKAVGTPELSTAAPYRLALKFNQLQPVYADKADQPPRLDVDVTVTVLTQPGARARTQFNIRRSAPASANTMTTVTKELGDLLQSVTDEALEKAAPYLG